MFKKIIYCTYIYVVSFFIIFITALLTFWNFVMTSFFINWETPVSVQDSWGSNLFFVLAIILISVIIRKHSAYDKLTGWINKDKNLRFTKNGY